MSEDDGIEDIVSPFAQSITYKLRWSRARRPKPFQLLPIFQLQRSMVYYGWTEIKAMFSHLESQYKKNKRKRGEYIEPNSRFYAEAPDNIDIFQHILDTSAIKGKKRKGICPHWRLCCFRTDGIKCVLTFASGMADTKPFPGAVGLLEVGYKGIKAPDVKVDVLSTPRGLYRINEKRRDMAPLEPEQLDAVEFTVVDPGFNRVVQCGVIRASCNVEPENVAASLVLPGNLWHVSQVDWMRDSGRLAFRTKEITRRTVSLHYNKAIAAFDGIRKRSTIQSTFSSYVKVSFDTFGTMATELLHKGRSIAKWHASRALQGFLARVANRMMKTESKRIERQPIPPSPRSTEETRALREQLKAAKERACKQVVLFGDGTFKSSMRGQVSLPKKALLKVLAATGLTFLLGEYNTSKTCPCGQDTLETPSGSSDSRVRVHKTSGGKCSVLQIVCNRDETANVQFGCCGIRVIRGQAWPAHLCRPVHT